jgi:thioredoxin 1
MKLLKFEAAWCGPCKMQTSVIKSLGNKITIPIEVIDVDENLAMGKIYAVRSVPTLILLDDSGEEIKRNVGALKEKDLLEFIKNDQEN